jgi:hypothetical protein
MPLTDAIRDRDAPDLYRRAARVMRTFFDIESQSFEMV